MVVAQLDHKSVVLATLESYKNWLETLNYSESAIKNNPRYVKEFIEWSKLKTIEEINETKIKNWFNYLSTRKHKTKAGGLSLNYLKGYRNALSQFSHYLRETKKQSFSLPENLLQEQQENERIILTKAEVNKLYQVTNYYADPGINDNGLLAARERIILHLYYGCGLRKNEGLAVETQDVKFTQNLLYVRKGKNYKERYVPMTESITKDLKHYLNYARPILLRGREHQQLLVGWYGSPLKGSATLQRVQLLSSLANLNKPIGLHTLRHSIATHLHESGMKLEQVAKFLGHGSLKSTQIYTHVKV